jgi:hypothetical protein
MRNKFLLKRVSFATNKKVKRNAELFDAGLHTLHLDKKEGEQDMEFATRFLVEFLKGCKNRGGKKYKKYYLTVETGDDYCSVWAIK